jgi:hypothetical protein
MGRADNRLGSQVENIIWVTGRNGLGDRLKIPEVADSMV